MTIFTYWVMGAILCAIVATAKGRSGLGWGLLGLLFCPLFVLIALCAVPNISVPEPNKDSPKVDYRRAAVQRRLSAHGF